MLEIPVLIAWAQASRAVSRPGSRKPHARECVYAGLDNTSLGRKTALPRNARAGKEATARHGPSPVPDGVFSDTRPIIRDGAQTDPPRFFLPSDHHPRKITEVPIAARAPADGTRRKAADLMNRRYSGSGSAGLEVSTSQPMGGRFMAPARRGGCRPQGRRYNSSPADRTSCTLPATTGRPWDSPAIANACAVLQHCLSGRARRRVVACPQSGQVA